MRPFNLEQLRTFVAVADAGSLAAGAPQVFLSQSAVSEQLRKLEQHAGQSLLVRSRAGVVPTAAGLRLLAHARQLLVLSESAWNDLRGVQLEGTLRLGVTDYFRPAELAGLLACVQGRHPGVRLQVTVQKSGDVEAGYAQGAFDVGIAMRLPAPAAGRPAGAPAPARGGQVLRREPLHWMGAEQIAAAPPGREEPLRLPERRRAVRGRAGPARGLGASGAAPGPVHRAAAARGRIRLRPQRPRAAGGRLRPGAGAGCKLAALLRSSGGFIHRPTRRQASGSAPASPGVLRSRLGASAPAESSIG